jgi:predicted Holliday junction resolvase-like endonuclease
MDCRSLFNPIDYIIFDGLSKGNVEKIVFSDIKTGEYSRLTGSQPQIRQLVQKKKVVWDTYLMEAKP